MWDQRRVRVLSVLVLLLCVVVSQYCSTISVPLWNYEQVVSKYGATVKVSGQGPNQVVSVTPWSFTVYVEVSLLNESPPFSAVAINVTEVCLKEVEVLHATYCFHWAGVVLLTEGQQWNRSFTLPAVTTLGSEQFWTDLNVSYSVAWTVISSLGESYPVVYWSDAFDINLHYLPIPLPTPLPIPGFPWVAIVLTLVLVLTVTIKRKRVE